MKFLVPCLITLSLFTQAQPLPWYTPGKDLVAIINKNFKDADKQYYLLMSNLPAGKFPKTWNKSRLGITTSPTEALQLETSNSGWWCSGFYPGTLLNIFQQTKDSSLYIEAMRMLQLLQPEQYNKTTHDLGFMMYCSFGTANRLHHKAEYDSILINSA